MKRDSLKRELYAEFLGTLVLIAFGAGVVAQVVLSNKQNGEYLSINIAWGFAVTMGVYVAGEKGTAGIFATYPQSYLSTAGALIDQIVGTALLLLVIRAIGDTRNNAAGPLGPIVVGFLVMALGMAFGLNAGYAINPARDLGPRLFTAVAGWRFEVFRANNFYFWVPIVGPLIGGPLGALVYDALIGRHFPLAQKT